MMPQGHCIHGNPLFGSACAECEAIAPSEDGSPTHLVGNYPDIEVVVDKTGEAEQARTFEEWLSTRPKSVQKLAKTYPPGWYRIKEDAPYALSCPGTRVQIHDYTEQGEIGVIVWADQKLPETLLRERELAEEYGHTDPQHDKDVLVHIDPEWMEPCDPPPRKP